RSLSEYVILTSGFDQTTGRSAGDIHLSASVPTSALSGVPCNKSVVFASSATLLLLTQCLVCCIHRLNPQPIPAARCYVCFSPPSVIAPLFKRQIYCYLRDLA